MNDHTPQRMPTPRRRLGQSPRSSNRIWRDDLTEHNRTNTIHIDEVFAERVLLHLVGNMDLPGTPTQPVILCITGPQGVGKTQTLRSTLSLLGVRVINLPASSLEDGLAGVPTKRFKKAYMEAAQHLFETNEPCVLNIDDVDLTSGDHGATGTTNTQFLLAALMEQADHPTTLDGETCLRVPIVITCNNVSCLYEVATRPGRMRIWKHDPTGESLQRIAESIFEGSLTSEQLGLVLSHAKAVEEPLSEESHEKRLEEMGPWTAARFAQLRAILDEARLRRICDALPSNPIHSLLQNGVPVVEAVTATSDELLQNSLEELAREHASRRNFVRS